jgi:translation initiation factor IF-2
MTGQGRNLVAEQVMRVHILAKQLGVSSKAILEKCRAEGLDVPNHMSRLTAGLEATVREWFSEGTHQTTVETAERVDLTKARVKRKRTAKKAAPKAAAEAPTTVAETPVAEALPSAEAPVAAEAPPAEAAPAEPAIITVEAAPPTEQLTPEPEAPPEAWPMEAPAEPLAPAAEAPAEAAPAEAPAEPEPVLPAGPQNIPAPPKLRGPTVIRVEAPETLVRRPTGPRFGGFRPPPIAESAQRSRSQRTRRGR